MNTIAKNIVAAISGVVVGSVVNIGIVNVGPLIAPLPEGVDVSSIEALRESMKLFTPANFVCPFLAHALGTLVGALTAAILAASHNSRFAYGIAIYFLLGGITMVSMIGGPMWFNAVDLGFAYIPMGHLGALLARRFRKSDVA